MNTPRVAIVHDYLLASGGAERVVGEIAEAFPDAPIYTGMYNPSVVPAKLKGRVAAHKLSGLLKISPKYLTFLMPGVFESMDLNAYDVIISSSSSYAKGVLTKPTQLHISYVHTPPRFLYKYSVETTKRNAWYYKPFVAVIDTYLRIWDYAAAQRPDYIVANSKNVQRRIKKFYRRESTVIYPPVDKPRSTNASKDNLASPYYLAVGRLSAYKNFDLLINAFNLAQLNLVIIGNGREANRLKKLAGNTITVMGNVDDDKKHEVWEGCLGFIFPVVEEDFGIVVVESLTHGKPVLAHRSGGPLEIIRDGISGMFFDDISLAGFILRLKDFDRAVRNKKFDEGVIKKEAARFIDRDFKKEFRDFVLEKWSQHAGTPGNTDDQKGS